MHKETDTKSKHYALWSKGVLLRIAYQLLVLKQERLLEEENEALAKKVCAGTTEDIAISSTHLV